MQNSTDGSNFLENLDFQKLENDQFPIGAILTKSAFYPGSEFDGSFIKHCNTLYANWNITNFVYCDYGVSEWQLDQEMDTFYGYQRIFSKDLNRYELIPNGWRPQLPPGLDLRDYPTHLNQPQFDFVRWIVYERMEGFGPEHGHNRISLLYLYGEGVATYQALYWTNNKKPKVVAVFDHGWGGNYQQFSTPNGHLHWVIRNNPVGMVEYIYYNREELQWQEYSLVQQAESHSIWSILQNRKELKNIDMDQEKYDKWVETISAGLQDYLSGLGKFSNNEQYFVNIYGKNKILDIGCGTGNRLGPHFSQLGVEWIGIEKFPNLIADSQYKDRIIVADIAEFNTDGLKGKFGLAALFGGVINGFIDADLRKRAFSNLSKIAKDHADYLLIDTLCHFEWFNNAAAGQVLRLFPQLPPQHFYSDAELQGIFEDHKLEIVETRIEPVSRFHRKHYLLKHLAH